MSFAFLSRSANRPVYGSDCERRRTDYAEEESVKNVMFPNCVSLGVPGQQEGQMAHNESSEQSPLHDAGQAVRELLNGTGTNQYG